MSKPFLWFAEQNNWGDVKKHPCTGDVVDITLQGISDSLYSICCSHISRKVPDLVWSWQRSRVSSVLGVCMFLHRSCKSLLKGLLSSARFEPI